MQVTAAIASTLLMGAFLLAAVVVAGYVGRGRSSRKPYRGPLEGEAEDGGPSEVALWGLGFALAALVVGLGALLSVGGLEAGPALQSTGFLAVAAVLALLVFLLAGAGVYAALRARDVQYSLAVFGALVSAGVLFVTAVIVNLVVGFV